MKNFKQFLTEMPLPDKWDEQTLNQKNTLKHKMDFFKSQALKIGTGSSRVAFIVNHDGRPAVIKVAKNVKGLQQNEQEVLLMSDYYMESLGILIPMIDYDRENLQPYWIMTEYAEKAKSIDFTNEFGTSDVRRIILCVQSQINSNIEKQLPHACHNIKTDSEVYESLFNLIGNYDNSQFTVEDFYSISNWGKYNGKLVIIDIGLTPHIYNKYYRKVRI